MLISSLGELALNTTTVINQLSDEISGQNTRITAKNDINLTSATNTQTVDGKNESKGGSIGAGISTGGWNVNASVNKGSGFEKSDSQFYTDTEVTAGIHAQLDGAVISS
ncbi:TPA: hemagglutinin repeat-containing protein [Providencia rettgeri]